MSEERESITEEEFERLSLEGEEERKAKEKKLREIRRAFDKLSGNG
jgi:PHD/YefM family antitoxin component YafN of YafNO toxin-antitoxin module